MKLNDILEYENNLNEKDFEYIQNLFQNIIKDLQNNQDIQDIMLWLDTPSKNKIKKTIQASIIKKIGKNPESFQSLLDSFHKKYQIDNPDNFFHIVYDLRKNHENTFLNKYYDEIFRRKINQETINQMNLHDIEALVSIKDLLSHEELKQLKNIKYKDFNKSEIIEHHINFFHEDFVLDYLNQYPQKKLFKNFFINQHFEYNYQNIKNKVNNPELLKILDQFFIDHMVFDQFNSSLSEEVTLALIEKFQKDIEKKVLDNKNQKINFQVTQTKDVFNAINKIILNKISEDGMGIMDFMMNNMRHCYCEQLLYEDYAKQYIDEKSWAKKSVVIKTEKNLFYFNNLQNLFIQVSDRKKLLNHVESLPILKNILMKDVIVKHKDTEHIQEYHFMNALSLYQIKRNTHIFYDHVNDEGKLIIIKNMITQHYQEDILPKILQFISSVSNDKKKEYKENLLNYIEVLLIDNHDKKKQAILENLLIIIKENLNNIKEDKQYGRKKI